MPRPDFTLDVVGADFPIRDRSNRRFEILLCEPGEPVALVSDPKNPADPNAVAVLSARGIQIGYLRAERAPYIGSRLRAGADVRAIFQAACHWGASIRLNLDGRQPTIPVRADTPAAPPRRSHRPAEDGVDPDPGFWPDETPPDD